MEALAALVIAARAGDREAFAEITRRFRGNAHARAFAVLGDYQLAEDAVQEAFAEACVHLDKLREPAAFPGWVERRVLTRAPPRHQRHRPCPGLRPRCPRQIAWRSRPRQLPQLRWWLLSRRRTLTARRSPKRRQRQRLASVTIDNRNR